MEPRIPLILFNKVSAYYAYNSMMTTGIKDSVSGFKKDKRQETLDSVDQEKNYTPVCCCGYPNCREFWI